jgi:hypothetical protein
MVNRLGYGLLLVMMLTVGVSVAGTPSARAAGDAQAAGDTYTWLGELVSVDAAARTMTVKSRVAYNEALSDLKQFKAGERIWVVWSGVSDSSDAVRQFRRPEPNGKITEPLVLPAELVSPEAANQHVTLRVRVPEASMAAVARVKPGEWVRVTSRQRPGAESEAVVAVKPYSESSTTTTSN